MNATADGQAVQQHPTRNFGRVPYKVLADELIQNRKRYRVTKGHPCPICGKPDHCVANERAAFCTRADGTGALNRRPQGEYGYLYRVGPDTGYIHPGHLQHCEPKPRSTATPKDWAAVAGRHQGTGLDLLAKRLDVPKWALEAISTGWDGSAWITPERDGDGLVVGLSRRRQDGTKRFAPGGSRGLTFTPNALQSPGPVIIVEGASDVAAGMALRLAVIGRPSNVGGIDHLAVLLEDIPEGRPIIIIAERDEKPDGRWPGRDGAIASARQLGEKLGRRVVWSLPPGTAKDLRAWYVGDGGRDQVDRKAVFLDGLAPKIPPLGESCTSCSIGDQDVHRATRTKPTLARYSGHKCPAAVEVIQRNEADPTSHRTVLAPCRRRGCPVCGPIWRKRHRESFGWIVGRRDTLHLLEVRRRDWQTIYRRIRRAGAEYVAVEAIAGKLTVITTEPIAGTLPITGAEAAELVGNLIDQARPTAAKPVLSSKGWRIAAAEKSDTVVGEKHDEPTDETVANTPAAVWKTVRKLKRTSWGDVLAGLQAVGVPYTITSGNPGGVNLVVHWTAPEGIDLEDLYTRIVKGQRDAAHQPDRREALRVKPLAEF